MGSQTTKKDAGFALLPIIGLLAMMTIMAAMVGPNLVTVLHFQSGDVEDHQLDAIAQGSARYLRSNRAWPASLGVLSPDYVPLDSTTISVNSGGFPRYYAIHPTTSGFSNGTGLTTGQMTDMRFLLISNLSADAAPTITNATEFQTWWTTDETATADLHITRGNSAHLFHQMHVMAMGDGGSFQIDGTSTNSGGTTMTEYTNYHAVGTVVGLDEDDTYVMPDIQFVLTKDVFYTFVPCLNAGQKWSLPPVPSCASIPLALWVSSSGNTSGTPGVTWKDNEIVSFDDPNLTYELGPSSTTNGTFAAIIDIEDFTSSADINAAHYVSKDITVGTSSQISLKVGDLLLSVDANVSLESTNSLSVRDEDIFIFRPDAIGNYSSGTFILLIDGSDLGFGDVEAVSLVEVNTSVAGVALSAGDILISDNGDTDIHLFEPEDVGTETGGVVEIFLDGSDIGVGQEWGAIELIERGITLGDVTLQPGQILATLGADDSSVGEVNPVYISANDIFLLPLYAVGETTSGDPSILFDGSDVGLTHSNNEVVDSVTVSRNGEGSPTTLPLRIVNPGFEEGDLNGWSLTNDLLDTDAENQWGATTTSLKMTGPHGGTYYGNAQVQGPVGAGFHRHGIYQRVDLIAYSAEIDSGNSTVTMNGYGHGETGQDYSFLRIAFYDAASGGNQLGGNVDSNTATTTDTWTLLTISDQPVPVGTRSIEIFGIGHKGVEGGTYENAGVDDISGTLTLP